MAAKPANVGFFVIFLSPLYLLYYRRASGTDNITTTGFKAPGEAHFFCGLVEILTTFVLPAVMSQFNS
jgi:hypothetical protein